MDETKVYKKEELNVEMVEAVITEVVEALKERGYTTINEENAKEVFEKIAEIQSRKV